MNKESLLEKYFEHILSAKEKEEFEQLLENDADFKREVEFRRQLQEVIGHHERRDLKTVLLGFEDSSKRTTRSIWMVAASVAVLVTAAVFWYANRTPDLSALYANHFEPYRNVVAPVVRNSDTIDHISKAFRVYEQGKHMEALQYFENVKDDQNAGIIEFYKANSLLALGRTEEAIAILEKNIASVDTLQEKHNWYLALAHLKMNNTAEAVRYLQILNKDASSEYKKKEVGYLLKKLD